jgi:hypothetical protein
MKARTKTTWYYLHTLDGKPAAFDGNQVHFMAHGNRLASSLDQIRAEQKASAAWRGDKGYSLLHTYGYRRVRLPD